MLANDISNIKERPCKFLFKSGRLVYGVIWEVAVGDTTRHYFASSGAFNKIKNSDELFRDEQAYHEAIPVELSDIAAVEAL